MRGFVLPYMEHFLQGTLTAGESEVRLTSSSGGSLLSKKVNNVSTSNGTVHLMAFEGFNLPYMKHFMRGTLTAGKREVRLTSSLGDSLFSKM